MTYRIFTSALKPFVRALLFGVRGAANTLIFLALICPARLVQAADATYLPLITTEPTITYQVEWVRLWSPGERSCQATPFVCRAGPTLQVDVFDQYGVGVAVQPNSVNGRLNGVQVEVTHLDRQGNQTVESKSTGPAAFDHGVALFDLHAYALVRLIADVDGVLVSSPVVLVATAPAEVAVTDLIHAGYCPDVASCQAWLVAGATPAAVSWGVVFKRQF